MCFDKAQTRNTSSNGRGGLPSTTHGSPCNICRICCPRSKRLNGHLLVSVHQGNLDSMLAAIWSPRNGLLYPVQCDAHCEILCALVSHMLGTHLGLVRKYWYGPHDLLRVLNFMPCDGFDRLTTEDGTLEAVKHEHAGKAYRWSKSSFLEMLYAWHLLWLEAGACQRRS